MSRRFLLACALVFVALLLGLGWWFDLPQVAGAWWAGTPLAEYRFQQGRAALRRQDWDRAEWFAARLDASGDADRARLLRGESLLERDEPAEAIRELNRITDEGALRLAGATLAGRCLLKLGRLREAQRAFLYVELENPDDVDAQRGLVVIAYDMGNLTAALRHLDRVAALDPADPRPHRMIGLIRSNLSEDVQAEAAYRAALERGPSEASRSEILLELADVCLKQTKYDAALEHLDRRNETERGEEAKAREIRAESLYGLARREELKTLLDRALREYPQAWRLWAVRGQLLLDERQAEQAIAPLERAVGLSPSEYRPRYLLAQAYRGVGRAKDAAEQEQRVKEYQTRLTKIDQLSKQAMRRPWDAKVRNDLADLFDEMHNQDLARMWRKAARACEGETPGTEK